MTADHGGELYTGQMIGMLEAVWGEGWLSPGGPEEVARVIDGVPLSGKSVLDIGCGVGGVDFYLLETGGAAHVTGIDVEETVLGTARTRARANGLAARTDFVKVSPGPLPFPPEGFDVVFSKDAIVHIPDKHALMEDVFRVLKPGGWFTASDWLIGHDQPPSQEMRDYIQAEGLDFGMASPTRYRDALEKAGFTDVSVSSRNEWYRDTARRELAAMSGPLYAESVSRLGKDFVDHNIDIWKKMIVVLDSGEHCPTHVRGRKPIRR
jgi:ubiquinone/menaquinone biosynthesis C-methylase UbiE